MVKDRGQILQENMRLKALAEIYTMHSFAELCNIKFCQSFDKSVLNFATFSKLSIFNRFFDKILAFF